jgi:hypothetical protein
LKHFRQGDIIMKGIIIATLLAVSAGTPAHATALTLKKVKQIVKQVVRSEIASLAPVTVDVTTVPHATTADNATFAIHATSAGTADGADHATTASHAVTAVTADTAGHATTAGHAGTADTAETASVADVAVAANPMAYAAVSRAGVVTLGVGIKQADLHFNSDPNLPVYCFSGHLPKAIQVTLTYDPFGFPFWGVPLAGVGLPHDEVCPAGTKYFVTFRTQNGVRGTAAFFINLVL